MFKEAEEKRLTSGELSRMRRRRRIPQRSWNIYVILDITYLINNFLSPIRFPGVVQGKELEAILKDEGVIEPDEENEENPAEEEDGEIDAIDIQLNQGSQDEPDEENAFNTIAVRGTFYPKNFCSN